MVATYSKLQLKRLFYAAKLMTTLRIFSDIDKMINRYKENIETFLDFKCPEKQVLVSIVVPTRNEAEKIPMLLKSLKHSYYRNLEVLVADYMSSDGTPQIARAFGARVIEVDKPGIGYASFLAVNEAKGDIIIRTDADAIFPPHIINYTINIFENFNHIRLVHLGHIYVDSGFIDNLIAFLYDKYWREIWKTTGHFIAFRREIRDLVNFNPELKIDEDFDFGKRVYEKFGAEAIHYNYRVAVLVSARRIKTSGRIRYLLGFRVR